jgi:4-amino-4-deoxy-L-arabinose transferase-like glycosyltransferase
MSQRTTSSIPFDAALLAVLSIALAARLWSIDTPLVDAHSWRQITNADIARHFAEGSLNPLSPRVSWGGRDGIVGMEFPLLQWITGVLWRLTGESSIVARLVAVVFSVCGVASLYALGARLLGRPGGLAAAWLMAMSPSVIFFGRSALSDTPMLTFMIAAVWAWDVYFEHGHRRWLVAASALTALCALVKLPAILVLAPIAGTGLRHRGWAAVRDTNAWLGGGVAVALVAAWYWHADRIFLETGLTQAVFRPSGTYPSAIAPGLTFTSVSHWTTMARLTSLTSWQEFVDRFWMLHLTPLGALSALAGAWLVAGAARAPIDLWMLGGGALFLTAMEGQFWHEFHQLPLLPPFFLYGGATLAPFFDPEWRARRLPRGLGVVALGAVVGVGTVQCLRTSGVEQRLYRPGHLQTPFIGIGGAVRAATEQDALIVTVEYPDGGANSPMLLYFAHRQGWSFDVASITGEEIGRLRDRGARYFATTEWQELEQDRPDVPAMLAATAKLIPLDDVPSGTRLFDLQPRR